MEQNEIKINGIYQHWKGDYYRVKEISYNPDKETKTIVIYHRCNKHGLFQRVYNNVVLCQDATLTDIKKQPFYTLVSTWNANVFDPKRNGYVKRFTFIKQAR